LNGKQSRFLDDRSLSSSFVSSVGSQRVRFFIEGVGYRAFRRPAVTTTRAISGLIKAGQRQPRARRENWKIRAEPRRGRRKQKKKEKNGERNTKKKSQEGTETKEQEGRTLGNKKNRAKERKTKAEESHRGQNHCCYCLRYFQNQVSKLLFPRFSF
jgi:hypothetical protein